VSIHPKARLGFVAAAVGACLLVAVPALGVNRDGVWKGSTSQDRIIRFEVEGDLITAVKTSVFHEACNLVVLANQRNTAFAIDEDGAFTMRFFGGDNARDRLIVRGEFTSRKRARGTFRSIQDNPGCHDTAGGTWSVEKLPAPVA
jgi:hypothetical protein